LTDDNATADNKVEQMNKRQFRLYPILPENAFPGKQKNRQAMIVCR
jgi:hypothetical protein